jgi:heptaprenyl diphosphate synthase
MRTATNRSELTAFLAALCLFLSTVEYIIPKPIPFLRLGLANLPVLISLRFLSVPALLLLILLKVLGQALVQGTLVSYVFLFSLAGTLSSGLLMILLSRILGRHISLIGLSVLGALASNLAQVILAVNLIFGRNGWLIAPFLFGIGLATSCLLGLFAERFVETSQWVKQTLAADHSRE